MTERWHCYRCRMKFHVGEARADAEWLACPEPGCQRRFWSTSGNSKDAAKVGVWPRPETHETFTDSAVMAAAVNLVRVWDKSNHVNATDLMAAVTDVIKAVRESGVKVT